MKLFYLVYLSFDEMFVFAGFIKREQTAGPPPNGTTSPNKQTSHVSFGGHVSFDEGILFHSVRSNSV